MSSPTRLRTWTWTAWLAVFGLVFAPTLSHALASARGDAGWVELCSAQGSRWVQAADLKASGDESGGGDGVDAVRRGSAQGSLQVQMSHCPLCGLSAHGGMAPPPAPWVHGLPLAARLAAGPLPARPVVAGSVRTPGQPRAPPLPAA